MNVCTLEIERTTVASEVGMEPDLPMHWQWNQYEVDTDSERIDMDRVIANLKTTYWAKDRTPEMIRKAWEWSDVHFGVYDTSKNGELIGFARVLTDGVSFAWLADVFVAPEHRNKGVGKFLVQCVIEHPDCADVKQFHLTTRDSHSLYRQFGWGDHPYPERIMVRFNHDHTEEPPR
ncbi:MAG: hypothetical protein AMXMBFR84_07000 [Candidatus Hydrogenedentota bacterium]